MVLLVGGKGEAYIRGLRNIVQFFSVLEILWIGRTFYIPWEALYDWNCDSYRRIYRLFLLFLLCVLRWSVSIVLDSRTYHLKDCSFQNLYEIFRFLEINKLKRRINKREEIEKDQHRQYILAQLIPSLRSILLQQLELKGIHYLWFSLQKYRDTPLYVLLTTLKINIATQEMINP